MQKWGQLQASIAVALIVQSGEAVCPAEIPSRAIIVTSSRLRITVSLTPILSAAGGQNNRDQVGKERNNTEEKRKGGRIGAFGLAGDHVRPCQEGRGERLAMPANQLRRFNSLGYIRTRARGSTPIDLIWGARGSRTSRKASTSGTL